MQDSDKEIGDAIKEFSDYLSGRGIRLASLGFDHSDAAEVVKQLMADTFSGLVKNNPARYIPVMEINGVEITAENHKAARAPCVQGVTPAADS